MTSRLLQNGGRRVRNGTMEFFHETDDTKESAKAGILLASASASSGNGHKSAISGFKGKKIKRNERGVLWKQIHHQHPQNNSLLTVTRLPPDSYMSTFPLDSFLESSAGGTANNVASDHVSADTNITVTDPSNNSQTHSSKTAGVNTDRSNLKSTIKSLSAIAACDIMSTSIQTGLPMKWAKREYYRYRRHHKQTAKSHDAATKSGVMQLSVSQQEKYNSIALTGTAKGLPNFGQTCFLNSVLQALASLIPFVAYLQRIVDLDSTTSKDNATSRGRLIGVKKEKILLSHILLDTIHHINDSNSSISSNTNFGSPKEILKRVASKHVQFRSQFRYHTASHNDQQDAQEFLQALIGMVISESQLDCGSSCNDDVNGFGKNDGDHQVFGDSVSASSLLFDGNSNANMKTESPFLCLDSMSSMLLKKDKEQKRLEKHENQRQLSQHLLNISSNGHHHQEEVHNKDDYDNEFMCNSIATSIGSDENGTIGCNTEEEGVLIVGEATEELTKSEDPFVSHSNKNKNSSGNETENKTIINSTSSSCSPLSSTSSSRKEEKKQEDDPCLSCNGQLKSLRVDKNEEMKSPIISYDNFTSSTRTTINSSSNASETTTTSIETSGAASTDVDLGERVPFDDSISPELNNSIQNDKISQNYDQTESIIVPSKPLPPTLTPEPQLSMSMQIMMKTVSSITPSPLSGWIGSTLQCCSCGHIRQIQNAPFLELPIVPTSIAHYQASSMSSNSCSMNVSPHSTFPSCSLDQCLSDFTSVERVQEVDCMACALKNELDRLGDEALLLRGAVNNIISRQCRRAGDRQELAEKEVNGLRRELEQIESQQKLLNAIDPDGEEAIDYECSSFNIDNEDADIKITDWLTDDEKNETDGGYKNDIRITASLSPVRGDANKRLLLTRLPSILCLHVKRLFYDPRRNCMTKAVQHIDFPELLDVSKHCFYGGGYGVDQSSCPGSKSDFSSSSAQLKYSGNVGPRNETSKAINYRLMSVIEHEGNAHSGHYITYRKVSSSSPSLTLSQTEKDETTKCWSTKKEWALISDEKVSFISWDIVRKCQAYMLFYEAI